MQRILFLLACGLIHVAAADPSSDPVLRWWQPPGDPLLVAQVTATASQDRWHASYDSEPGPIALSASLQDQAVIRTLYQCRQRALGGDYGQAYTIWFRLPAGSLDQQETLALVPADQTGGHRWQRLNKLPLNQLDEAAGTALLDEWRTAYRDHLRRATELHDDTMLEAMLAKRHGLTIRDDRWRPNRSNDLLHGLLALTGYHDLRAALPELDQDHPQAAVYDQEPPEPISLPAVPVDTAADPAALPRSARYVPRSCMYLHWQDSASCRRQLTALAALCENWSPGFWGMPADAILARELDRLGIDDAVWQAWAEAGVDDLAIASWDAAFAAGTSVLVYVHAARPLPDLPASPHHQRIDDQTILLATDAGLLKRSLTAMERQRAVALDPHLTHAWQRLPLRADEREQFFCFLSDYWFTNLVSPRWQILTRRLQQVDARIRLAEILRELQAREQGSDTLPSLDELRAAAPLADDERAWMLADLQEKDGRIVHSELGGITDHPPIDQLPFTAVSADELAFYERFSRQYSRNWRQMDPVAIRWTASDTDQRLRVYVSPISRRSEFGQLRGLVLDQKQSHRLVDLPGIAGGISVILRTEMASGLLGQQLPLIINLQAQTYDTAPRSLRPNTWLSEPLPEDEISWFRMPAVLIAPRILFDQLLPLAGTRGGEPSPYPEISYLDIGRRSWYRPMVWRSNESNVVALGVDPGTLGRVRDTSGSFRDSEQACDLYAWVDGLAGYQLRGKCMQLLVKNRSLANWRRSNLHLRIARQLGSSDDQITALTDRAQLPPATIPAAARGLPPEIGEWSYSGSAQRSFADLPAVLTGLNGLTFAVSIEDNALAFETRLRFDAGVTETLVPPTTAAEAEPQPAPGGLDFDTFE